jgi:hypothetical protein
MCWLQTENPCVDAVAYVKNLIFQPHFIFWGFGLSRERAFPQMVQKSKDHYCSRFRGKHIRQGWKLPDMAGICVRVRLKFQLLFMRAYNEE